MMKKMKKKLEKFFKKYKLAIIIAFCITIIGLFLTLLFINNKIKVKTFSNDNFSFKYDESWKVKKKDAFKVELKNSKKAKLDIEIISLEDEYKYSDISNILNNLLYDISNQNKDYSLISKKDSLVTSKNLDGYKILYENKSSQAMVVVFKDGDKLIMFNYEADNKYFDMILDSVQNIIYNFKLKPVKFDLDYKISVDTKDISYSENKELENKLKSTRDYDIANKHYYVNYSLPSIFKLRNFNSNFGAFAYSEDKNKIDVTVSVNNTNIYDFMDSSKSYSIYSDFKYIKNDKKNYKNFTDKLSEYKIGKYKGYIYKVNYEFNSSIFPNVEVYTIAIELNKNHIFLIKLEGNGIKIPKELLESIKINSVKNYASYIDRKVVNGMINAELKRFIDYNYIKYDLINIKLPEKYTELDKNVDMSTYRYFGLNYDSNNDVYQYDIKYSLSNTASSLESQVEFVNSSMNVYASSGEVKNLTSSGTIERNGKKFLIYDGYYTEYDVLYSQDDRVQYKVYKKLLLYELENGGYIVIEVDGNNISVSDEILNEVTNFDVKLEEYK